MLGVRRRHDDLPEPPRHREHARHLKRQLSGIPNTTSVGKTDEAHRVSGRIGKPWAVVHDNQKIPSLRRLYMTATPRLWQLGDEDEA